MRSTKKKTTKEFIIDAISKHQNRYDYSKVEYKNNKTKVVIICKDHGEFEQKPNNHLNGQHCPKCNGRIKKTKEEFIKESKKIFGDYYDYSKVKYINNKTNIIIICPKHGEFKQRPDNHFNHKIPCKKCDSENRILEENTIIKRLKEIHNNYYDYSKLNYKGQNLKGTIICPKHGEFNQTILSHLNGTGCPKCNQSYGEKEIHKILKESNINFKTEYKFDDCVNKKHLRFDFYIPSINTCIEYNGKQHYKEVPFFGGKKYLKLIQKRDKIKENYCCENGINLITIKYTDKSRIKEILEEFI